MEDTYVLPAVLAGTHNEIVNKLMTKYWENPGIRKIWIADVDVVEEYEKKLKDVLNEKYEKYIKINEQNQYVFKKTTKTAKSFFIRVGIAVATVVAIVRDII